MGITELGKYLRSKKDLVRPFIDAIGATHVYSQPVLNDMVFDDTFGDSKSPRITSYNFPNDSLSVFGSNEILRARRGRSGDNYLLSFSEKAGFDGAKEFVREVLNGLEATPIVGRICGPPGNPHMGGNRATLVTFLDLSLTYGKAIAGSIRSLPSRKHQRRVAVGFRIPVKCSSLRDLPAPAISSLDQQEFEMLGGNLS